MLLDSLVAVISRTVLGFFLSSILGLGIYLITLPAVLSVWDPGFVNYGLMGILAVGIGAGVGGFLAWLERGSPFHLLAITLAVSIGAALGGAWGGLQHGQDVYIAGGRPGIPALAAIIVGAILGANLALAAIGLLKVLRNPRL